MSTTTTDFANAIYMDDTAGAATTPAAGSNSFATTQSSGSASSDSAADSTPVAFDLNDPNLLNQDMEFDASVDPFAVPPPVPDGRYRVKLKQIDVKGADGQPTAFAIKQDVDYSNGAPGTPIFLGNGQPKLYITTGIEATIIDHTGKYDNIKLFDRFMDSRANRNGGVPMIRVLTVLGVKLPSKMTTGQLKEIFKKALAGEPEVEVETAWEGSLSQEDAELLKARNIKQPKRVKGMHRFPEHDGKRVPFVKVDTTDPQLKVEQRAQATIVGYFPLGK